MVRVFETLPDRESVRRVIRELMAEGTNAFVVLVGGANRFALEMIQSEPVVFATDFAVSAPRLADSLLFSIEDRMDDGLSRALAELYGAPGDGQGDSRPVVVASRIVPGKAYDNPQLEALAARDAESEDRSSGTESK